MNDEVERMFKMEKGQKEKETFPFWLFALKLKGKVDVLVFFYYTNSLHFVKRVNFKAIF